MRPRRGRLVLSVDDGHLLDDLSAALVRHVALTGTCVVLVTVRNGVPAPDAIMGLWKEELAELRLLSRTEVEAGSLVSNGGVWRGGGTG